MNSFYVFVVVQAVLVQTISASCIRFSNVVSSPVISTSVVSPPILTTCVSTPLYSAPCVPTTTIIKDNSVANKLADVLAMLPVTTLLNQQLPLCPSVVSLPVAAPVYSCGCSCGCGPIFL